MAQNFNFINRGIAKVAAENGSYSTSSIRVLALEVTGLSGKILIDGCMNDYDDATRQDKADEDCVWSEVVIMSAADYSLHSNILEDGLYYIDVSALRRVRFTEVTSNEPDSAATITAKKVE